LDLWSYTILFAGVAASWIGIPIVGGAVLAAAGALAGDGQLDVWLVVLVATAGAWTGGYVGYLLGARAGDALTSRRGRWPRQRRRALELGQRFYRRWGPLGVFLTSTWVSGALRCSVSSRPGAPSSRSRSASLRRLRLDLRSTGAASVPQPLSAALG
jgi:membrane protein DedA with SNARE-associated domain